MKAGATETAERVKRTTRPRINSTGRKGVCHVGGTWSVKVQHPGSTLIVSRAFNSPEEANAYYGEFPYPQVGF
jgi:hypothetical protein